MIVESLEHGKKVVERFQYARDVRDLDYIVLDTETKSIDPKRPDDALVYSRAVITIFSIAFQGQAYSFPCSEHYGPKYPTALQWAPLFKDIFEDSTLTKVVHNWIYDWWVFETVMGLKVPYRIWCTLIGAWCASEYISKGLKSRALRYGRVLNDTSDIDFADLRSAARYAEQDVLATEELFLAQTKLKPGEKLLRFTGVEEVASNGKLVRKPAWLPSVAAIPGDEVLNEFKRTWMELQEIPILRSTIRAQRRGFPFDLPRLYEIRKQVLADRDAALKRIYKIAGQTFNVGSSQQISAVCDALGIDNTNKTKSGKASFNAKAMSKLKVTSDHPFLASLAEIKALEKLIPVYIGDRPMSESIDEGENFSGLEYFVNPDTGCIHSTIKTVGAITGRASSDNPNLQQVPSRKDKYGIKECFVPSPVRLTSAVSRKLGRMLTSKRKRLLIVLDYSQLEIRVMCLFCRDPEMTRILSDPHGDIHTNTSEKFGVARDPYAKNLNFLLLYGGEDFMLSETLTLVGAPTSVSQAATYRKAYNEVYPRVAQHRQELLAQHRENGYIRLWCKRTRHIDGIDWSNKHSVHKAETTLSNNQIQGSGQDFLKASIVRLDYRSVNPDKAAPLALNGPRTWRKLLADYSAKLEKYRHTLKLAACDYHLQVHDELAFIVDESAAEECLNICADVMSWQHYFPSIDTYNIPLVAEGGVGYTWKHAKGKEALVKVKRHGIL